MAESEQRHGVATPWGRAFELEAAWVAQDCDRGHFASGAQLLETAAGERLVRFAYTTDGRARRGPVTLRLGDLERLAEQLRERPALRSALAGLARRR